MHSSKSASFQANKEIFQALFGISDAPKNQVLTCEKAIIKGNIRIFL